MGKGVVMKALAAALFLALLGFTIRAQASVVRRVGLETLVARSDAVVRGRVVARHSRWDAAHRWIFTDSEIVVTERIVGSAPARVRVRHLGGTANGTSMYTIGEVSFFVGEEVVLFLARSSNESYRSVALAQGKLRVVRSAGRPPLVERPGQGSRSLVSLVDEIRTLEAGR